MLPIMSIGFVRLYTLGGSPLCTRFVKNVTPSKRIVGKGMIPPLGHWWIVSWCWTNMEYHFLDPSNWNLICSTFDVRESASSLAVRSFSSFCLKGASVSVNLVDPYTFLNWTFDEFPSMSSLLSRSWVVEPRMWFWTWSENDVSSSVSWLA